MTSDEKFAIWNHAYVAERTLLRVLFVDGAVGERWEAALTAWMVACVNRDAAMTSS